MNNLKKAEGMLEELIEAIERCNDWEREFVESVAEQFERKGDMTEKQMATIGRIHEQRILGW